MKTDIHPLRLVVKTVCLFVIINVLYALLNLQVSEISAYNILFPGLTRLPFGTDSFSVMIDRVDTMLASHAIAAPKARDEYRVVLIGDSSVWGEKLRASQVISAQWNTLNMQCGGKKIKVYDLGYPHPSVIKDLIILEKAVEYKPDLVIWFVTLNTLNPRQISAFLEANPERLITLLKTYRIPFQDVGELKVEQPSFYERTLIGQRSNLARQIKLQLLGTVWAATGEDNDIFAEAEPPDFTIGSSPLYRGLDSSSDITHLLLFDALKAGIDIARPAPVLIVNEPIYIANGKYASLRYNGMYPRWAYDQFRTALAEQAQLRGWHYLDVWNAIPPEDFLDAGVHRTAASQQLLIQHINPALQSLACNAKP